MFLHASEREEFRLVFSPCIRETRGAGNGVFTIAVRQHGGTVAAIGFGNPHDRDSQEYRACALPADAGATFWIVIDAVYGWIVFGHGAGVAADAALLMLKLPPSDARVMKFAHVCASNWVNALIVRAELGEQSVEDALALLLKCRDKFDVQGQCCAVVGATVVCALEPTHALHAAMTRVHDAIRAEPLLCGLVSLLPPPSYHMTVMDLFHGHGFDARSAAHASSAAATGKRLEGRTPLDPASLDHLPLQSRDYMCFLAAKLESSGVVASRAWTRFPMRVTDISVTRVSLSPWDDDAAAALIAWRKAAAGALGLGVGQDYQFHATISYPLFPVWKQRCAAVAQAMERVNKEARVRRRAGCLPQCVFVTCCTFFPGAFFVTPSAHIAPPGLVRRPRLPLCPRALLLCGHVPLYSSAALAAIAPGNDP